MSASAVAAAPKPQRRKARGLDQRGLPAAVVFVERPQHAAHELDELLGPLDLKQQPVDAQVPQGHDPVAAAGPLHEVEGAGGQPVGLGVLGDAMARRPQTDRHRADVGLDLAPERLGQIHGFGLPVAVRPQHDDVLAPGRHQRRPADAGSVDHPLDLGEQRALQAGRTAGHPDDGIIVVVRIGPDHDEGMGGAQLQTELDGPGQGRVGVAPGVAVQEVVEELP